MKQHEIREQHDQLVEQIADLQGEIEVLRARCKVLQAKCKHPNSYRYSAMGDIGSKCPDCGWAT